MTGRSGTPSRTDVAIVGAGPVGLTLAARLGQRGIATVLLEAQECHAGEGSKALCMQRETLETWARIGIGETVARRGVQWNVGRTYFRGRELFSVRLPAGQGDRFPPFVNISQTEVEELLLARLAELSSVELRWGHRLIGLSQDGDAVHLRLQTSTGEAELETAYLVGTDGGHSAVREALGIGFPGHTHDDLFLIADIRASLPFPNERRFFFDPPGNPGRQVLVHPQPDDTWRIDWQVAPETDVDAERRSGRLERRIRQVVGDADYQLVWLTAYRFHQRLADRFRAGRAFLAGDAAHLMSPFGARGLNSGVADAENLAWKLALALNGAGPAGPAETLLDSYAAERRAAALDNLAVTDATMRFMVPGGPLRRAWRNLVLRGSGRSTALRRRVNSGRLAEPFAYGASAIIAPGPPEVALPRHGSLLREPPGGSRARLRLRDLLDDRFAVLLLTADPELARRAASLPWPLPVQLLVAGSAAVGATALEDADGALRSLYAPTADRAWVIRPDAYLAASASVLRVADVDALRGLVAAAAGIGAGSTATPAW